MKDKNKVFLREYKAFRQYALKQQIPETEIPQLFAIHRKDNRPAEINGFRNHDNGDMATARQKAYIKRLAQNSGDSKLTDEYIDSLSKQAASKLINNLRGGDDQPVASQPTSCIDEIVGAVCDNIVVSGKSADFDVDNYDEVRDNIKEILTQLGDKRQHPARMRIVFHNRRFVNKADQAAEPSLRSPRR